jgi:hypothetical protein
MDVQRRFVCLLVCAAAVASVGCYSTTAFAPVEIDYTFGGKSCLDVGVATIQINVAGEVLTPNTFSCAQADIGVDIGPHAVGFYTITIQGFDANGNLLSATTTQIQVLNVARNVITIDLPAVASPGGTLTLLWTFGGQSCAQAGVSSVRVSLDGTFVTDANNNTDLPCTVAGTDGTTISGVSAGNHVIDLQGFRGAKLSFTLSNISAAVQNGADTSLTPNLQEVP